METIDEIIELSMEPPGILDLKPHFVLPGQIVRLFVVNVSRLMDSMEQENIPKILIKTNFANQEIQKKYGQGEERKELKLKRISSPKVTKAETKFYLAEYEFQISESGASGSVVGQVQVTDGKARKYSLLGQGHQNFQISENGEITVACNNKSYCLDRESKETFYLIAIAADLEQTQSSASPVPVTIHVLDENDNGPVLQIFDKEIHITNGEILDPFLISMIDMDSANHQNNKLDLEGPVAGNFVLEKISDSLFQLKIVSILESGEYSLKIVATDADGKNPSQTAQVKLVVTGSPQSSVHFKRNLYERSLLPDKLHKGNPLAQLELEGVAIDAVSFVILENPGWLAIESFGGNVFVGDVPKNSVKAGHYVATVAAVDRESQKIVAKCQIEVNIVGGTKVEGTTLLKPFYSFQIPKDTTLKNSPYKLTLFDKLLENVHIEVVEAETEAWGINGLAAELKNISTIFNVSNTDLLVDLDKLADIRLIHLRLANRENANDRTLVSISLSSDPQQELSKLYRLSKPRFVQPWVSDENTIKLRIPEEVSVGHLVLRLPAFNTLTGKLVEKYTLTGEDAEYFECDPKTASIHLQKQIDFEQLNNKMLHLQLNAYIENSKIDSGAVPNSELIQTSTAKLEVEILDIDDNAPKLKFLSPTKVEIAENSKPGTTVAQFSCIDTDSTKLHYQLTGKESSHFRIQQKNDVYLIALSPTADLDREKIEKIHLMLSCIDPVGNLDQIPLEIVLLDENDNRPLFKNPSISDVKVYDNWLADVPLMQFQAIDKDLGNNSRVIYSLEKGTESEKYFSLGSKTGLLTTKTSLAKLSTSKPYVVTVIASDSEKSPKFSSTSKLLVHVHDASSSSDFQDTKNIKIMHPEIDFLLELPEDVPVGRKVFDVVAQLGALEDSHKKGINYSLEPIDNSDGGWLSIDEISGEIYVLSPLDYETQKFITVVMTLEQRFDSVLRRLRTRLSRRQRSSSVDVIDDVEEVQLDLDKRKRASSLRSRRSVRKGASSNQHGKLELLDNGQPVVTLYPNQKFNDIQSAENLHYTPATTSRTVDNWSTRFRELQRSLRASRNHLSSPHAPLSRQQSVAVLPDTSPLPARSYRTASAEDILERDLDGFERSQKSTHFPVDRNLNSSEYDVYGGYLLPTYGVEEKQIESGYGSTAATNTTQRHISEESYARSESISGKKDRAKSAKQLSSKQKRRDQLHQAYQHNRLNFSPKSLETLIEPSPRRYNRAITDMSARRGARSEMDIHRLGRRYSSALSNSTYEAIEFLRERIKETKYVTAVFESTKGGLAPVLGDIMREFAHWLGAKSRLLAVACEVHWSVPEKFRSRAMEITMKDSLHRALRDNNKRVLNLYDECRKGLPSSFIESKTEENCAHDAKLDAFQGIYRRYYPEMLSLQDPTTVVSHKSYWTLENLNNQDKNPLRPSPAKFLYKPTISQLGRKSVVAVNMATLRLDGDDVNYDAESVRSQEILVKITAKSDIAKNKAASRLLRIKVINVDDHKPEFLQSTQGNIILVRENSAQIPQEEENIGRVVSLDEDVEQPFNSTHYYLLPQCSNQGGEYRIEKASGEIFKTNVKSEEKENVEPVHLCAYTSSSANIDESPRISVNNSEGNQLAIKIYSRKQLDALENSVEQAEWQNVYFNNNSIINLEPELNSARIPFHLESLVKTHSYTLNGVDFQSIADKTSKKVVPSTPLRDLISVDAETGDLMLDPMLASMHQGVYSANINVHDKLHKDKKNSVKIIKRQVHLLSNENRLKFVFDESTNLLSVDSESFKKQLEAILSSEPNSYQIQIVLSQLQIYSSNRLSLCFHLTNTSQYTSEIIGRKRVCNLAFKVINIESCLTVEHSSLADSLDASSFTKFKLTKQLVFWIALELFEKTFWTRKPIYKAKRKGDKRGHGELAFATPQFIDARKITSAFDY
uniref:Cadherin domain-containing protein n=1 Tax=Ditylenchus dipsaci TaxID=166011 RepID=A0A915E8M8_9BILA